MAPAIGSAAARAPNFSRTNERNDRAHLATCINRPLELISELIFL
jgi:hypothetical protein